MSQLKPALIISVGIFLAAGIAVPSMGDDATIKEQVQAILVQRHPVDTDESWRALGPDAPPVIIGMYQQTTNTLYQIHLLQGLSAFSDNSEAADFLRSQSKSDTSVLRNAALGALGASQGEKALDTLSEALKNDDAQTRFAAAKAIHRIGGPRASQILDGYLKSEKVDWIANRVLADQPPATGLRAMAAPEAPPQAEDFAGEWSGFWIEPATRGKQPLVSLAVKASLRTVGKDKTLEGEITFAGGGRQFKLSPAKIESGRWKGTLRQTSPVRSNPVAEASEAELSRRILLLRVHSLGVNVVLSR
jgi:hypothetical protein